MGSSGYYRIETGGRSDPQNGPLDQMVSSTTCIRVSRLMVMVGVVDNLGGVGDGEKDKEPVR